MLDNGFVQWIMNSSKPPVTGDFCLGVWQKNGPSSYQLNHFESCRLGSCLRRV